MCSKKEYKEYEEAVATLRYMRKKLTCKVLKASGNLQRLLKTHELDT